VTGRAGVLELARSRAAETAKTDLRDAFDLRQLAHSARRARSSEAFAVYLVAEVQVSVDRHDIEAGMFRQRPSDDRWDRVVTADHERHRALADDPGERLSRPAHVFFARAQHARDVSNIDQARPVLTNECAPQIEVVMGENVGELLARFSNCRWRRRRT